RPLHRTDPTRGGDRRTDGVPGEVDQGNRRGREVHPEGLGGEPEREEVPAGDEEVADDAERQPGGLAHHPQLPGPYLAQGRSDLAHEPPAEGGNGYGDAHRGDDDGDDDEDRSRGQVVQRPRSAGEQREPDE